MKIMEKIMLNNQIEILGSISPYSKNKDSCPGYLIKLKNSKILLDCGSGIANKLNIPNDLYNLNIFISHFHKDHYLDLYTIGYASFVYNNLNILNERIKVYIPKVNQNSEEYLDYLLLKNLKEHYFEIIEYDKDSKVYIDNTEITFMKNYHSVNTYSTKINILHKAKLVYTSDLGYKSKEKLIEFSKNVDLLLIESSFVKSDNINNEYHLHAFEAATIAKEANVKKMVLTHFWPEHDKKIYLNEAIKIFKNTELALSNKKIKF